MLCNPEMDACAWGRYLHSSDAVVAGVGGIGVADTDVATGDSDADADVHGIIYPTPADVERP